MTIVSFFIATSFAITLTSVKSVLFSNCDSATYYSSISEFSRDELHQLLLTTHRNVLPYTSSTRSDTWAALIDLDGIASNGTTSIPQVRLLYSEGSYFVPAYPHGDSGNWNREHIWPKSLGVGTSGADYTDIHHLRPADSTLNSARGNKFFGSCPTTTVGDDVCVRPAHAEAASDTETNNEVWLPPANQRGDVARALMYMDLRYDGEDDPDGLDLVLSDCLGLDAASTSSTRYMGYLSQLLQWHQDDPVNEFELERNNRACSMWQGNRNVFVDFPELADVIFGTVSEIVNRLCQNNTSTTTVIPSISPTMNTPTVVDEVADSEGLCHGLEAGDVMVTAFNSNDPDTVEMVVLRKVQGGTVLYMTDNAWTGYGFRNNEGTMKLVAPINGFEPGTKLFYNADQMENKSRSLFSNWQKNSGSFQLSTKGDSIIVYCKAAQNGTIRHISAITNSDGKWMSSNATSSSNTQASLLPQDLPSYASVALSSLNNWMYNGPRNGTEKDLQLGLSDAKMWIGSNDALVFNRSADFILAINANQSESFPARGYFHFTVLVAFAMALAL